MKDNPIKVIDKGDYCLTNHRVKTRRGVIWLGQTCNLRCYFCYFKDRIEDKKNPEHPFMSLAKAKNICDILVKHYNQNSIDIQGGEPTIFPDILPLINHCRKIGLKPTIISNVVPLAKEEKCLQFKETGIFDFLLSIHALGDDYDRIVQLPGAFKKQMQALGNLAKHCIPFRFNTVLSAEALRHLENIGELAVDMGARACNFIGYNNSGDQLDFRKKEKIPYYTYIVEKLIPVIDFLTKNEIEVNVRYMPLCVFPRKYRKHLQNNKQKIYDLHEWEFAGRAWIEKKNQRYAALELSKPITFSRKIENLRFRKEQWNIISYYIKNQFQKNKNEIPTENTDNLHFNANFLKYRPLFYKSDLKYNENFTNIDYAYNEYASIMNDKIKMSQCKQCFVSSICDGIHSDYLNNFNDSEFNLIKSPAEDVFDPLYYAKEQMKVVEQEEYGWALPAR